MAGELLSRDTRAPAMRARFRDISAIATGVTAPWRFGITYANQTVKDWEALRRAIRLGKVKA